MRGQRRILVSSHLLEAFLCGETQPAESTTPKDIRVIGARFDAFGRIVAFLCDSEAWPHVALAEGAEPEVFDPIFTTKKGAS